MCSLLLGGLIAVGTVLVLLFGTMTVTAALSVIA